jgi:hypothetical protein
MYEIDEIFQLEDTLQVSADLTKNHATVLTQSIVLLAEHSSSEAALIRLLSGTTNLLYLPSSLSIKQPLNHAILGSPRTSASTPKGFEQLLSRSDINIAALDQHLRIALKQGPFYTQLILEAAHYFHRTHLSQHCVAFLHVYRILERISFPLPVIYAAESDDFIGAFQALKNYVIGDKSGELKFFTKFAEAAIDRSLLDSTSTIRFSSLQSNQRTKAYNKVLDLLDENAIDSKTYDSEIVVKNRALVSLLVNIRNRFFHFLSDHSGNFSLLDIPDPDGFFGCLNECFFNWLATIYFEILRRQLKRIR